jgi:AcrR family transcriptional regulator
MKKKPVLRSRKQPKQARSRQMREDILAASIRVLRRHGALRFTTSRVAEAAGISVGSLYQYFPNKQALMFALHSQAVEAAWSEVQAILAAEDYTAREKIRRVAKMFFMAESEEAAEMGTALQETEIFFAGEPEHHAMNERVLELFTDFVRKILPRRTSAARVQFGAQVLVTVLESVGKGVAAQKLSPHAVTLWSATCADMVADFLGLD